MKVDADAAGMDARRLERVGEHLRTRYVDPGKIAGCQVVVARHGEVALAESFGHRDLDRDRPVTEDTIWRLYSMTKPVTGVALLTLYERGMFQLSDPVHRFLPEFRDVQVQERLDDGTRRLVPPSRPPTVRDLMMHMAGLGYSSPGMEFSVETLLRGAPSQRGGSGQTLETFVEGLATKPLRSHPGTEWLYAWSTDVCARLVEVLSGQRFDDYLRDAVFGPLGMDDTGFWVPDEAAERFAASYTRDASKRLTVLDDPDRSSYRRPPEFLSGGGGLVGTSGDYLRFCRMLLGGGELDGVRILSRTTIDLMASNHLPGEGELRSFVTPGGYGEVGFDGMGFGLTVAVSNGPVPTQAVGSRGEYLWGGLASTLFWIDPVEQLICIFMTQLLPSGTFNFRGQLKAIIHGAIAD